MAWIQRRDANRSPELVTRLAALDGLRGLAILAVLCVHFKFALTAGWIKTALSFGWIGVDLFFALSGFLITGILIDTRSAVNYYRSFYARRVLRIFPLYYLTLLAVFGMATLVPRIFPTIPIPADRKLYFLYAANLQFLHKRFVYNGVLGHFWSLAIEEQFYGTWPVITRWLKPTTLLVACLAGGLAALAARISLASSGDPVGIYTFTLTHADSLLAGACAAVIIRDHRILQKVRRHLPGVTVLAMMVIAVCGVAGGDRLMTGFGISLLAIIFGATVLMAAIAQPGFWVVRVLRWRLLTTFGAYSYGIYVLHVPLREATVVLFPGLEHSGYIGFFGFIAASYLLGWLSYSLMERHFLTLKRFFQPRPAHSTRGAETEVALSTRT